MSARTATGDRAVSLPELESGGPEAPPRSNGELVFAAPWESRAFGLAIAMHRDGLFAWEDFRQALIAEIAGWERQPSGEWSYYRCWLAALERVLETKGICLAAEQAERRAELAARPHGHDH